MIVASSWLLVKFCPSLFVAPVQALSSENGVMSREARASTVLQWETLAQLTSRSCKQAGLLLPLQYEMTVNNKTTLMVHQALQQAAQANLALAGIAATNETGAETAIALVKASRFTAKCCN